MRLSKIALGLGLAAVTAFTAANAAKITVDYRHELRSEFTENFDRICFIAALDNGVGFYVDSSVKSGSNRPDAAKGVTGDHYEKGQWGDFSANAVEMSLWYGYKIGNFTITPGIITETAGQTAYKPYVRLQYNTDFGLWFAVRPRYDYARNDTINKTAYVGPDGKVAYAESQVGDYKTARIDAWIGYNSGNFGINYNYTHMWRLNDNADGTPSYLYDNKDTNYEQNIAVNYRMGQWNPYFEIGDMAVHSSKDDRQLRFRAGIQYTF